MTYDVSKATSSLLKCYQALHSLLFSKFIFTRLFTLAGSSSAYEYSPYVGSSSSYGPMRSSGSSSYPSRSAAPYSKFKSWLVIFAVGSPGCKQTLTCHIYVNPLMTGKPSRLYKPTKSLVLYREPLSSLREK